MDHKIKIDEIDEKMKKLDEDIEKIKELTEYELEERKDMIDTDIHDNYQPRLDQIQENIYQ
jgi:hypothetical protein